jgi:hypothetical protein
MNAATLGASDCERVTDAFLAQPFNAITSLAFIAAGAWIIQRRSAEAGRRAELVVLGIAVTSVGTGSVLFHGPQPPSAAWAHDVAIMSVLLFVAWQGAGLRSRATLTSFALTVAALGALAAAVPSTSEPLTFGLVAGAACGELWALRRGHRRFRHGRRTRTLPPPYPSALVALGIGLALFELGGSASPLCEPHGSIQLHGLWHVLAALGLAAYSGAVIEEPARPRDRGTQRRRRTV